MDRRRTPAPAYSPDQKVWLSAWDLPLQVESILYFGWPRGIVGPYVIEKLINSVSVKLKLPASLRVHSVFHVSLIKPVLSSPRIPSYCTGH